MTSNPFAAERGTGRTRAMVLALPAGGSTVLVHTAVMRDYLRKMLHDLRGVDVSRRTRIFVATDTAIYDRVCTNDRPIFADHAWYGAVSPRVYEAYKPLLAENAPRRIRGINIVDKRSRPPRKA